MKHLNKIFVAVMMVMGLSSQAQDSNNPWAISFGVNAVDTKTSAGGGHNWLDKHFSLPFAVKDNWNILPSVSYLSVARSIGDNFSFGLAGSVNKIDKYVKFAPTAPGHDSRGYVVSNPGDLMYYGIDAIIKYSFMNAINSKVIDPSLSVGGGYTFFGDSSYGTLNPGAGLTFWFTENVGLELATKYKKSFGDRENASGTPDAPSHFQHSAGIIFKFGGKDTDGDGVADKDDACPDVAGLASMKGCPDTDGDGIADKDDKCPTVAGPKDNAGCPWPDTDKDGVLDKDDECPTIAGPASNKGCPEVTAEALDNIKVQARAIYFNSGKSTFKSADVPARLDAMTAILKNYPNAKFIVEGHTDSDGSDALNMKLSQDRADVVKNALIERGIKASNINSVGYGESKPVETNKTAAGKAKNRRTEVILEK